jgi:hypothetical protein
MISYLGSDRRTHIAVESKLAGDRHAPRDRRVVRADKDAVAAGAAPVRRPVVEICTAGGRRDDSGYRNMGFVHGSEKERKRMDMIITRQTTHD